MVGLVNAQLGFGVAIHYNTKEFPRCTHWQHFAPREYVAALEPANAGVEGRDKDRQLGWLDRIAAGGRKTYRYSIEIITNREDQNRLVGLNSKA